MKLKTKKTLLIAGIIISLVAIYWFFFRKKEETITPVENKDSGNKEIAPSSGTKAANLPEATFPLRQGSKGRQVLYMQAVMNINNGTNLILDGEWGPQTSTAVLKHYPSFGGNISWVNYRKIYSAFSQIINSYLKEKGLA